MSFITNVWLKYWDRSYTVIMNSLLAKLGYKVPEITDHTPNNPYVRDLAFTAGMIEQLGYYVDNVGRETFIDSARLYKSLISIAKEHDYKVIGNVPYSVDVTFSIDVVDVSPVVIPAGAVLTNAAGDIKYRTVANATIDIGDLVSDVVSAIQSELVTGVVMGTSSGLNDIEVEFTGKIVHDSVVVRWNGIAWQAQDTLAYSSPIDTHFVQTVNENGNVVIYFGSAEPSGATPIVGETLEVDYYVTLGLAGKVLIGELNTILSGTPVLAPGTIMSVTNIADASGGSDVETIEQLKRHIPLSVRTLNRAVTRDDFVAITEQAAGVERAGLIYTGKKGMSIYIVPTGGGIASTLLISTTLAYVKKRSSPFANVAVFSAGEVVIIIEADITAKAAYSNAAVNTAVENNLLVFLSYLYQNIKGKVNLSDIYQIIEDTPGVDSSVVTKFVAVPYARPTSTGAPALVWSPVVQPSSTTSIKWTILFTNATTFKLIKGATVMGTYTTGTLVNMSQVQFTIPAGAYSNGNTYEFYTYPYNSTSISLLEPSIPVTTAAKVTLNVTGGY